MPPSNDFLSKPESRVAAAKVYDKQLVRTDSRDQKIDKFLSTSLESVPLSNKTCQSFISKPPLETSQESFTISPSQREVEETPVFLSERVDSVCKETTKNTTTTTANTNPVDPGYFFIHNQTYNISLIMS